MTPPLDERIVQVSERNPGALTTLQAASKELPKNEFEAFLDELEALHITGPRVWLGFKDHCDQDIACFIEIARRIPRPLRSERKPTLDDINHERWQGRLPHV